MNIEGGAKRPAMLENESSEFLYAEVKKLAALIDVRICKEHRWSSADICHIEQQMPKIDGLGPVGEFLPTDNERIIRHSLVERALLLALLLKKSC